MNALYGDGTTTYSISDRVSLLRTKNAQLTWCGRRRYLSPEGVDACRRYTPRVHNLVIMAVVLISPVVQGLSGCCGGSGRGSGAGISDDWQQEMCSYIISELIVSTRICQSIEVIVRLKSSKNCPRHCKQDNK